MIKLIIEGKELTNVSQEALKWFLTSVRDGVEGPFTYETINGKTQAIILTVKLTEQIEMFG